MRSFLKLIIRLYKILISPWLGRNCRFAPTCSEYAQIAIDLHGPVKGSWLGFKRVCRCHPWGGHGFDPVPGSTNIGNNSDSEESAFHDSEAISDKKEQVQTKD